jgi:hypothetical protein
MVVVVDNRVVLVLFLATPMVAVAGAVGVLLVVTPLTLVVLVVQLFQVPQSPLLTTAQYTEAHNVPSNIDT